MSDTYRFALIMSWISAVVLVAVLANRLTDRFKLPAPLLMLVAAAVAAQLVPGLPVPSDGTVQRVVTVALVLILFDGGMHIGWARFRPAAGSIALVGVLGTFLTAAGGAAVLHVAFGGAVVPRTACRYGGLPDRSGGCVLGSGAARDRWSQRHDLGGRVGSQRSGRYRFDGWSDRGWHAELGCGGVRVGGFSAADGPRRECWDCRRDSGCSRSCEE